MNRRIAFLLFFLSGFAGLLYQVVWLRLAQAQFGVITPVMSVVISVFMLGLALGSWAGGRWIPLLAERTKLPPFKLYAVAEVIISVGAFLVPFLYKLSGDALVPLRGTSGAEYLLASAALIVVTTLPWCVAMGATTPFMLAHFSDRPDGESSDFSFLYLANTVGAALGALATGWVIIEFLGFRETLYVGALINLGVAVAAWKAKNKGAPAARPRAKARDVERPEPGHRGLLVVLLVTGFVAMAVEVLFLRMFTPVLKTTTYAFSLVLTLYLLSIALGAAVHRRLVARNIQVGLGPLILATAIACVTPLLFSDPRLNLGVAGVVLSIAPPFFLFGLLTPRIVDAFSSGRPADAGRAYALNAIGCVAGPLAAAYVLLPSWGLDGGLLILAGILVAAGFASGVISAREQGFTTFVMAVAVVSAAGATRTMEDNVDGVVHRDHTATVVASGSGYLKNLMVNGVYVTALTVETKLMAHMACAALPEPPKHALVICFGMGTTFRSLASWGAEVTAVELVPGVAKAFPFFYPGEEDLLKRPGMRLVIDDGRRFLRRTNTMYDVISLYPPPPASAAGSSLLYSTEFYEIAKRRLKADGILQQWIPVTDPVTLRAVAGSLRRSFPHVRAYRLFDNKRLFLASRKPIIDPSPEELARRLPPAAMKDLMEREVVPAEALFARLLASIETGEGIAPGWRRLAITDDRAINEYTFVRRHGIRAGLPRLKKKSPDRAPQGAAATGDPQRAGSPARP